MTTHLDDVRELLGKYDALDVGRRMDAGGQAILEEVRTRGIVSIAESLDRIARYGVPPVEP